MHSPASVTKSKRAQPLFGEESCSFFLSRIQTNTKQSPTTSVHVSTISLFRVARARVHFTSSVQPAQSSDFNELKPPEQSTAFNRQQAAALNSTQPASSPKHQITQQFDLL